MSAVGMNGEMSTPFDKIAEGLREAIAVARGEIAPAKVTTFTRVTPADGGGHEESRSQAPLREAEG